MPRPPVRYRRPQPRSPRKRVASVQAIQAESVTTRQQLTQNLAKKSVGKRPVDSDDSDNLVTRRQGGQSRSPSRNVYASGGVAKGDTPGAHPSRVQRLKKVQNETRQVIRENSTRSNATNSRSTSPLRAKSPLSRVVNDEVPGVRSSSQAIVEVGRSATSSPQQEISKLQTTPLAEISVLGNLKPRRRQPSILHMIENNDSSVINSEDEERFLPDFESTPQNNSKDLKTPSISSTGVRSSRKRKFGSDNVRADVSLKPTNPPTSSLVRDSVEPLLPRETSIGDRSSKRSRHATIQVQSSDDVMAPPLSSSPEPEIETNTIPNTAPVKTNTTRLIVPSTADLQSHMPTKRRKGTRSRTPLNEFDIPADSSSDHAEGDESAFLPQGRTVKGRKKATKKATPSATIANSRAKGKSKKTTSTAPETPRPSSKHSLRTPLPLTRSVNAENRKLKSPSILQSNRKSNQNSEIVKTPAKKGLQYGGSLRTTVRSTRQTRALEVLKDKENIVPSIPNPKVASSPGNVEDNIIIPNSDNAAPEFDPDDAENIDYHDDIEVEVGRGTKDLTVDSKIGSDEVTAWKRKWADIDDFEMEYEEVSVSTGSESPLRR